ncbi:unnamed protein product [Gordionus sp. m RMFG-2023]|uniref:guanine nucleotide exchange factor MSS4-like n=1 Tax=Gordionus sp. m RMFG-2023 TaxID=3053472 RepID=UPI0030DED86D
MDVEATSVVQVLLNEKSIICSNCKSLILKPNKAQLVNTEIFLPHIDIKKSIGDHTEKNIGENITQFWRVKSSDIYIFENIGFTHSIPSSNSPFKYLACADCEIGPLGVDNLSPLTNNNNTDDQNSFRFFIACSRVSLL